jgi:hypothetical protein
MGYGDHPSDSASAVLPGDPVTGDQYNEDEGCPISGAARLLGEYSSGSLGDDEVIQLFEKMVDTGLIEFMNEDVRTTAESLVQAGYIQVAEASAFQRSIDGQQAQQGTPHIQVKSGAAYRQSAPTAPVSTVSDIGSQLAQGGPAQVPTPPGGQVTSQGHDKFPDSGGPKKNPAKIKKPAGSQKAGPNHGDDMSGGSAGVNVGNSLQQQEDPERDDSSEYTGSQVGQVEDCGAEHVEYPVGLRRKKKKKDEDE